MTRPNPYLLLTALTLICLVPFCGKAFHMDDPLFIWAAQQIAKHPLDPYGFKVLWYWTAEPMAEVTMNPPLASYYLAGIGKLAGWSEVAMHLAFLLPALAAVLGTYRLAERFTRNALLAAAATFLAPGFLVSSTNVMCDTAMLAAWILATLFWLEGLDKEKPALLVFGAVMIAVCALTKYFGMALIPLLLVYSIAKKRRAGSWLLFLLIPVLILAGYQFWTHALYGRGLLSNAAQYASEDKPSGVVLAARMLVGLSFAGGCALPVLTFVPVIWSRLRIFFGLLIAAAGAVCCELPTISSALGTPRGLNLELQLCLFIAGGVFLLGLALSDLLKNKDAESAFLLLWVLGTFIFAAFVNWSVNARSVLPLVPAAGILLARRIQSTPSLDRVKLIVPLAAAGFVSLWVAAADTRFADSARDAAQYIRDRAGVNISSLSFEGHWGFQYYMQRLGVHPIDFASYRVAKGKVLVLPENNSNYSAVPPEFIESQATLTFDARLGVTTIQETVGAGFYADTFGPLPYAFGPAPPEHYTLVHLKGSGLLDPDFPD